MPSWQPGRPISSTRALKQKRVTGGPATGPSSALRWNHGGLFISYPKRGCHEASPGRGCPQQRWGHTAWELGPRRWVPRTPASQKARGLFPMEAMALPWDHKDVNVTSSQARQRKQTSLTVYPCCSRDLREGARRQPSLDEAVASVPLIAGLCGQPPGPPSRDRIFHEDKIPKAPSPAGRAWNLSLSESLCPFGQAGLGEDIA